jgi:hypothetical protein
MPPVNTPLSSFVDSGRGKLIMWAISVLLGLGACFYAYRTSPHAVAPPAATTEVSPQSAATRWPQTPAATAVSDGVYEVGVDIWPGFYRSVVPQSAGCAWEREDSNNSVASGTARPGASVGIWINVGDATFRTRGCGRWVQQSTYQP